MSHVAVYCKDGDDEEQIARLDWIPRRGEIISTEVLSKEGHTFRRFKVIRVVHSAIGVVSIGDGIPHGKTVYVTVREVTNHGDRLIPVRGDGWTWDLDRKIAGMVLTWVRDTKSNARDIMVGSLSIDILRAVQDAMDRNW